MTTPAEKSELEPKRRPRFTPGAETVSRYPYSSASRLATLGQEVLFLALRTCLTVVRARRKLINKRQLVTPINDCLTEPFDTNVI